MLDSWLDVGHPWDLLDANAALLEALPERREGTIEEGVVLTGKVSVGAGSVLKAGTYIEGPCVIGEDCRIGPHTYIRGATAIGSGCHIGHATEIKNSIVMPGTKIPHFNYVGDSVIGSGCNFGAGTKVANLRHDHRRVKVCGVSSQGKFARNHRRRASSHQLARNVEAYRLDSIIAPHANVEVVWRTTHTQSRNYQTSRRSFWRQGKGCGSGRSREAGPNR